jgi:hypothetical protein
LSTFPDGLFQYGGQPVGTSSNLGGMWGGKVWFVDYDHGTTGGSGDKPSDACINLQTIIDKASVWDTIYIRPRDPDTTGGDPASILPASTSNWDVPYTLTGLSLIGTGGIGSKASQNATRLKGSATVNTTPVLYAKAPYMTFENLAFQRGGSTNSGLKLGTGSTPYAFSSTVNNCLFWKIGSTATGGALNLNSWHNNILNSYFEECYTGIYMDAAQSNPVGMVIKGCTFGEAAASVSCDIYCSNSALSIVVDNCIFAHAQPSAGSPNLYIDFVGASTGIISNSVLATATGTIATAMTNNGVLLANVSYAPGTNMSDHT